MLICSSHNFIRSAFTDLALEILKMVVKCLRFHGVLQPAL